MRRLTARSCCPPLLQVPASIFVHLRAEAFDTEALVQCLDELKVGMWAGEGWKHGK